MFFYKKCYKKEKELNEILDSQNLQIDTKVTEVQKKIDEILKQNLHYKEKLIEVTNELNTYKSLISVNELNFINVNINNLKFEKDLLEKEIHKKETLIMEYKDELLKVKYDYYVADENDKVSFAKKYSYTNLEDYENHRKEIKSKERLLKTDEKAVNFNKHFLIDNDEKSTKKFVKNTTKSVIEYFDIICQNYIKSVKISNYEKIKNNIVIAAEKKKSNNELLNLSISNEYLQCKLDELDITYELNQKKEEEKEERRRKREEKAEEEKVIKEIEERRAEIDKEEQHLTNKKEDLEKQIREITNIDIKEYLITRIDEINQKLNEICQQREELTQREANKKIGYVYIISNIGAFGENVYKIGMTRRLEPKERISELSGASVPFKFDIHAMIFSEDAPALEAKLHRAFADKKVNAVNQRKEFFNVSLDEIKKVVTEQVDKSVKFVDCPDADEFRISMQLRNK